MQTRAVLLMFVLLAATLALATWQLNSLPPKEPNWEQRAKELSLQLQTTLQEKAKEVKQRMELEAQLKAIEQRTAETNALLELTRRELAAITKKYQEAIAIPAPIPVPKPHRPVQKKRKKIPYDIAPSQQ